MTDAQSVIRAVNRAEEVWDGLKVRQELRSHNGPSTSGAATSRPPVDLGMVDLSDHIAALVQSWAKLACEEAEDDMPADQVPAQADHLRGAATWIARQAWSDDLCDELEEAARKGIGMLGMLPQRTPLPEPCSVCGARQWVYRENPPIVRCRDGHESQIVEHLHDRGTGALTHADAAWVLGISRTAVTMAIKRGTLNAGDTGGVTVASVRARLAH